MDHATYIAKLDQVLDGTLDFVEVAELRLHENTCDNGCVSRMIDRAWERLEERDTFLPLEPRACLRDETLKRWLESELSEELWSMASEHLDTCPHCREKAEDVAEHVAVES